MIGGDAGAGGDGGADGGGDGGCDGGDATATTVAAAVTAAWCKGPCLDGLRCAPVLEGEAATAVVAAAVLGSGRDDAPGRGSFQCCSTCFRTSVAPSMLLVPAISSASTTHQLFPQPYSPPLGQMLTPFCHCFNYDYGDYDYIDYHGRRNGEEDFV